MSDERDTLWAPWRMEYLQTGNQEESTCPFCFETLVASEENLVLHENDHSFIILNRYPYIVGHCLVVPRIHVSQLNELPREVYSEVMQQLLLATQFIKKSLHSEGFNIGINLGKAAGAGISQHLHWHIVPRWTADTNFLPILAKTRTMPEYLKDTYHRLMEAIHD